MKTNYVTPSIEIIEVEIEDAVLQNSLYDNMTSSDSLLDFDEGGNAW